MIFDFLKVTRVISLFFKQAVYKDKTIFLAASNAYRIFQIVSEYSSMFQNVPECM